MTGTAPVAEAMMPLLQTILSVLLALGFLAALISALLLILKVLQSIRGSLEQIALGVRAIEHQLKPMEENVDAMGPAVEQVTRGLDRVTEQAKRTESALAADGSRRSRD